MRTINGIVPTHLERKKVRRQNVKNHLKQLKDCVEAKLDIPSELYEKTSFFIQQEIINNRILKVLNKMEELYGE